MPCAFTNFQPTLTGRPPGPGPAGPQAGQVFGVAGAGLAGEDEGGVARGQLDQDEVQDHDCQQQSEYLNQPESDAPGERRHLVFSGGSLTVPVYRSSQVSIMLVMKPQGPSGTLITSGWRPR